MNLAKIQKQLVRDVKRSPAKAAALAVLCLVALWFWAPLVSGWLGMGQKKLNANDQVSQAVTPPPAIPVASVPVAASVPWHKVVRWMEDDGRMRSAQLGVLSAPPFAKPPADVIDPGETAKVAQKASTETELDVSQLGLKLSSTMLGPRRRVAVINGRPYAEGGELQLGDDIVFTLARVADRSVLLEYNGKRFELSLGK